MTFGRSPHDGAFPNGFGSAAAPDTRLDAPYGGRPADGFGGRGSPSSGFGGEPLAAGPSPFGAEPVGQQPFGPVNNPDRPVTHAELVANGEHERALVTLKDMLSTRFESMRFALDQTASKLLSPKRKQSSWLIDLANLAAGAAIAGAAGVVAEALARRMSARVASGFENFTRGYQRFATDAVKEVLKKSFHVSMATRFESPHAGLVEAFHQSQFMKINVAQDHFNQTFMGHMSGVSTESLTSAIQQVGADNHDAEVISLTSQQIAVEWANLIARVHHGAGDWDPWAGEYGSADAKATHDAAPPREFPSAGAPRIEFEHPSTGNVDAESESIRDVTDDDQRSMNPTMHGILEINLWGSRVVDDGDGVPGPHRHTRFALYDRRGHGMRLAGVSDRVKGLISSFEQVRDLKMNKVIAIYDNEDLNPPKPVGRFLITADGYIRRSTTEGGDIEMGDAADFAQSLSPARIQ